MPEYDVFLSHAHADNGACRAIRDALRAVGLAVWYDEDRVDTFAGITQLVLSGLTQAKALLLYYSLSYPTRRSCQWELTAAFVAAQRLGEVHRRILVINPEPTGDHIEPIELRDARWASPADLQALAAQVRDRTRQLTNSFGQISLPTPAPWFGNRGHGSPRFVDRQAEFWRVHSALHRRESVMVAPSTGLDLAQLHGFGGTGKSLLAEEYALRFGAAYPGGVFWMRSSTGGDAERHAQIRSFARHLGIDVHGQPPDEVEVALDNELRARQRLCLWIVDDVPAGLELDALRAWCGPNPFTKTLVTTRGRDYDAAGPAIAVGALPHTDAYTLLTVRRSPQGAREEAAAVTIVNSLGHHPLAIDVASAALYATAGAQSFQDFAISLDNPSHDALELAATLVDALPNGHEPSIAATLLGSIRQLAAEGLDLLLIAAQIDRAPVPIWLVREVFAISDRLDDLSAGARTMLALVQAERLSLSERLMESEDARAVHPLISRTVRFANPASQRRLALREGIVAVFQSKFPEPALPTAERDLALQHGLALLGDVATRSEADLLGQLARYSHTTGAYRTAASCIDGPSSLTSVYLDPSHSQPWPRATTLARA